ncbi:MAG TPA: helix-turn-helix domain-containing protein [Aliidongia sp.]|uniref:helix-turn-helix domain-containing protein n=1 Tax=Aliidongia sp. TaxID=1914230 RepID=UPI002DDCCD43|nr:helix-turn-helix domain-containing protein [Aliidongia sp.]HEV2678612.1 helix-turn-helix domain-containing protein [Aliidongia sp.]
MDHLNGMMIARAPAFGREAYQVLWYLTDHLDFSDFAVINTGEISSNLGLKSQAVSRALRVLTDGGVIERGPKVGQRSSYRFSRSAAGYAAPRLRATA